MSASEPRRTVERVLREHELMIDWQYETVDCYCGWLDPDSLGKHTVKDGSRSWLDHFRRTMRRALAEPVR